MLETSYSFGVMLGLGSIVIYMLVNSFFTVEEGCVAIVTSFGKLKLKAQDQDQLELYGPGFHLKRFWHKVIITSAMEQHLDLGSDGQGLNVMTRDGSILKVSCRLRYSVLKNELYDFVFKTREAEEHIREVFMCLLRAEISRFKSSKESLLTESSSYAQIMQERKKFNAEIEQVFKEKLSSKYGIIFHSVDLLDVRPPEELAIALNAVVSAQSEAETLLARAEAECEQKIISSEKALDIAMAKANAVEIEIITLSDFLSDLKGKGYLRDYIDRRKAEIFHDVKNAFVNI